jgi:hypothetical protein
MMVLQNSARSSHTALYMRNSEQFEAIKVMLSVEQGVKDLPFLLSTPSKTPETTNENFGSRNYGARPMVIGVGGGFDDAMVEEIRSAYKNGDEGVLSMGKSF